VGLLYHSVDLLLVLLFLFHLSFLYCSITFIHSIISYLLTATLHRYLWPLIHYHKFLAKCIKKLKRHGFTDFLDPNASTVISFLRYEICAVSNHLAACSKFDSDQWLSALKHFEGWNDTSVEAQEVVRVLVAKQKLRSFMESRDVQSSPLLRKAMESVVANSVVGSPHEEVEQRDSLSSAGMVHGQNMGYDGGKAYRPGGKQNWKPNPVDPAAFHGYAVPYDQVSHFERMEMFTCFW